MQPYQAPTAGTRIAVWMFPALTLWLGLGYLFGSPERFQSGAFEAARQLWAMHWWGVLFITVALIKIGCLLLNRPRWYVAAMCLGAGLYACWAFLFAASVLVDNGASPGSPAWALFVVASHVATLATLRDHGAGARRAA